MGYRGRLGKIKKTIRDKYFGKSYNEVESMLNDNESPYRLDSHTQLYELGKYIEYNEDFEPFYSFDIYEECESEFHIMKKEDLKNIIEDYHNKILEYYKDLKEGNEDIDVFLNGKINEWNSPFNLRPYYLDQEKTDGFIVSSWKYEYAIFNLVYIYRSFDWENDFLIYSAW